MQKPFNNFYYEKVILYVSVALAGLLSACSGSSDSKYSYKLIPVKSSEQWGFVSTEGKYVINPQFESAYFFSDGLALVQSSEGKFGYVGSDGKYIINANYKEATNFSDGLAFVVSEGGYPTCIDKKGEIKFALKEVEQARMFSEGLAPVKIKGQWGFVDKKGEIVIAPQFDQVGTFSEGLVAVANRKDKEASRGNLLFGYVNKKGEFVVNLQFREAAPFSEGLAAVSDGEKYGFIDKKGSYVINPQFRRTGNFREGLAPVKQGDSWGFIDKKGTFAINPQFQQAFAFSEGLAAVLSGHQFGFVDKEGKFVINPQFGVALPFTNGFAIVLGGGNKAGFINKEGKYLVNPQFDDVAVYLNDEEEEEYTSVETDYYDATEFVTEFFKEAKGSSFDGLSAETTVQKLREIKKYSNDLRATNDKYELKNYGKRVNVTPDVAINGTVGFRFSSPAYTLVPRTSYYGYGGHERHYNASAQLSMVTYNLTLTGKAYQKGNAVAAALKSEIEKRYSVEMAEGEEEPSYSVGGSEEKPSFTIFYSQNAIEIIVGFVKKQAVAEEADAAEETTTEETQTEE